MLVERAGLIVLGVHGEGAKPRDVGRLQSSKKGILQQSLPDALPVAVVAYGETGKQHDQDGAARPLVSLSGAAAKPTSPTTSV